MEARLQGLLKDGTITRYTLGVPRFGQNQFNTGNANAALPDDAAHKISSQELAAQLNKDFSKITAIRAIASVRPSLQRGGGGPGGGGGNVDLIVVGNEYPEIERLIRPLMTAVQANPGWPARASITSRPRRACWWTSTATRPPPSASRPSR
uniref:Efflux RND transporter permease subunit n=1 Tax=Phenylobacterium glaciei TaxID=2803784 RepID=A0A974S827_9CAUL|nr:efflux RND transporter permease subunit [Phenylobacterium glaciei]